MTTRKLVIWTLMCLTPCNIYAQAQSTNPDIIRVSPVTDYNNVIPLTKAAPIRSRAPLEDIDQPPAPVATPSAPTPAPVKPTKAAAKHVTPKPQAKASAAKPASTPPAVKKAAPPAKPTAARKDTLKPEDAKEAVKPAAADKPVAAPKPDAKITTDAVPAAAEAEMPVWEPIDPQSIAWDDVPAATPPEPAAVVSDVPPPAPVSTIAPVEDKPTTPPPAASRQALGSVSGSSDVIVERKESAMGLPTSPDTGEARELDVSLMRKIKILEMEKEQLRRKVIDMDARGLTPLYQCATESNKIKILESQLKAVTEDNQALRKKNEELITIPKIDPKTLDSLPDVKPDSEKKS
jgi:hypothetical protein